MIFIMLFFLFSREYRKFGVSSLFTLLTLAVLLVLPLFGAVRQCLLINAVLLVRNIDCGARVPTTYGRAHACRSYHSPHTVGTLTSGCSCSASSRSGNTASASAYRAMCSSSCCSTPLQYYLAPTIIHHKRCPSKSTRCTTHCLKMAKTTSRDHHLFWS